MYVSTEAINLSTEPAMETYQVSEKHSENPVSEPGLPKGLSGQREPCTVPAQKKCSFINLGMKHAVHQIDDEKNGNITN